MKTNEITRPLLRYFGGKWRLFPWINSFIPPHTTYVEPFCGAANVFLRKQPAEFEIINDLDGKLVNFFRVLREHTEDLIKSIELTPYSRQEYELSIQPTDDPLECARRYYVRIQQGWGGAKGQTTWRTQKNHAQGKQAVIDWTNTTPLWQIARRLREAFIEHDDALAVIKRFDAPHTLFYCDPPYLVEGRRPNSYTHEYKRKDHVQLLDTLKQVQGMTIISGYPSQLYDQELATWYRAQTTARTINAKKQCIEVLWISPAAMEARQQRLFQITDAGQKTQLPHSTPAIKPALTLA